MIEMQTPVVIDRPVERVIQFFLNPKENGGKPKTWACPIQYHPVGFIHNCRACHVGRLSEFELSYEHLSIACPRSAHGASDRRNTPTHSIFVELKEPATKVGPDPLGPRT